MPGLEAMVATEKMLAGCSTERSFADDVEGVCSQCGAQVFVRPETATLVPREDWYCIHCLLKTAGQEIEVVVTKRTIEELRLMAMIGRRQ